MNRDSGSVLMRGLTLRELNTAAKGVFICGTCCAGFWSPPLSFVTSLVVTRSYESFLTLFNQSLRTQLLSYASRTDSTETNRLMVSVAHPLRTPSATMVPRLGVFPGGTSRQAENLSVSELVFRTTIGATSRNAGAIETSTSPRIGDNPEGASGVTPETEISTKESVAENPTEERITTKETVLERGQPLQATSSGLEKTVADEETAVGSAPISTGQENSRYGKS